MINKIIQLLEKHPCVYSDLPGKISPCRMSFANRERIRQIRVAGKRTNRCFRCGRFQTVYYLEGDEDRAAKKFVEVNAEVLARLNLRGNTALDSGLNREMAQRIRGIL